ncbi:MAG: PBP1A family penicillin-binding protein, partial [Alphaproteobacteria bacterium]
STITQQVMKNFLLSSDRSAERKIKEIILAARVEQALSKDRSLELYLNEIFLGQNSYGVTAAAQTYFNKTLDELTPAEAAYLAALPKAPSKYHPVRERERAIARRNYVLREMAQNGYLDPAEAKKAMAEPLRTVQSGDIPPFSASLPPRDYFTEEIARQLSSVFGPEEFYGGGLKIRATVDPELQRIAARALRRGLERYDRKQGIWRGPVARLPREVLAEEARWRKALARVKAPRDIEGWRLAVVLEVGARAVRVGVEGVPEVPGGHAIPFDDMKIWAPATKEGKRGRDIRRPGDLLAPGDVVFVKPVYAPPVPPRRGELPPADAEREVSYWSLRQIPELEGAFMAMDPQSGRVVAMQGGFSYQHSVFNRATQARRQPGSAFKPFVYAAALDSGYTPATIVIDAPIEIETAEGIWRPKNSSNKFYGPTPLRTGIEQSRNLMTVRLARAVGMDVVARYAERFGVYDSMAEHLANALGSQETTLFRMVSAYAMFANGGERVVPTLVDRVQDRYGRTIYAHDRLSRRCLDCADPALPPGRGPTIETRRKRVIDPITAYQITSMMRGVVERGTARRTVRLGVPVAGKTGTTNDSRDVWFIGFTPVMVAGCYMGFDNPRSLGHGAYGGSMCGPVFAEFMQAVIERYGAPDFPVPPGGTFVKIDRYSGERLPDDASGENVVAEYFRQGTEPVPGVVAVVDGGFAMGSNLPRFEPGELPPPEDDGEEVVTSMGIVKKIPKRATFGSLSSGGLY